jgi:hypothetical protein
MSKQLAKETAQSMLGDLNKASRLISQKSLDMAVKEIADRSQRIEAYREFAFKTLATLPDFLVDNAYQPFPWVNFVEFEYDHRDPYPTLMFPKSISVIPVPIKGVYHPDEYSNRLISNHGDHERVVRHDYDLIATTLEYLGLHTGVWWDNDESCRITIRIPKINPDSPEDAFPLPPGYPSWNC